MVIVLSLACIAVLALLLSRSIVLPIRQTVESTQRIANGDLTHTLKVQGKDETAEMMNALNRMQTQLRETISHITDSSQQLAATSEELSTVTNDASEIVHKQAEQLEQAATAVNEMTAAIDEVANNANLTSQNAETLHSTSQEGHGKLINMVAIRDLSFQTSAGANQTNASSQELAGLAERLNGLVTQFQV